MIAALLALVCSFAADERDREPIAARIQPLAVAPLAPGANGELSLVLLEQPERALPLALRLDGGDVALLENRLGWSAVVDPQALQPRLRAPFAAPAQPGMYVVEATIDYQICVDDWCRHKHGEVEWTIEVVTSSPST